MAEAEAAMVYQSSGVDILTLHLSNCYLGLSEMAYITLIGTKRVILARKEQ